MSTEKSSKPSKLLIFGFGFCILVGLTLVADHYYHFSDRFVKKDTSKVNSNKKSVVASVNGEPIYQQEIILDTQQNEKASYADKLDQYIQLSVLAEAGQKLPANEDVNIALIYAKRKVYANYWLSEMRKKALTQITEKEVEQFYNEKLDSALFRSYKVAYYASPDNKDAEGVLAVIQQSLSDGKEIPTEIQSRFTTLKVERKDVTGKVSTEEYLPLAAMPYGFGNLIPTLKKGQFTGGVLPTREGFFILQLQDIKENPKPKLTDIKDQIKDQLLNTKLGEMGSLERSKADIRNK